MLPTLRNRGGRSSWTPFRSLGDGFPFSDRVLSEMFDLPNRFGEETPRGWAPRCEISEHEDALELTAETPGMSINDLNIEVEDNVLTITGEKSFEEETEKGRTHLSERAYGTFERSFRLPASVDAEKINAHYDNGVLTVEMPKTERSRGRKIQIESGS